MNLVETFVSSMIAQVVVWLVIYPFLHAIAPGIFIDFVDRISHWWRHVFRNFNRRHKINSLVIDIDVDGAVFSRTLIINPEISKDEPAS